MKNLIASTPLFIKNNEILDKALADFSKEAFRLKQNRIYILLKIAEEGPMNKNQIRNSIGITRRKIEYSVEKLVEDGFLQGRKAGGSYRGIKNAFGKGIEVKQTLYRLTFKGLLASLQVWFQENYLVKNFVKVIKDYTDEQFSKVFLEHMKICTALFLIIGNMNKTNLKEIGNIEWAVYDLYDTDLLTHKYNPAQELSTLSYKNQDLYQKLVDQFNITGMVLGNLLRKFKLFPNDDPNDMYEFDFSNTVLRGWATIISKVYNNNYRSVIKKLIDNPEFRESEHDIIRAKEAYYEKESKKILNKLNFNDIFDDSKTLIEY